MIVRYFDPFGAALAPDETNAPLVIDADAVLPDPVSLERFQPIAGRCRQILQFLRGMDLPQFSLRDTLNIGRQPSRKPSVKKRLALVIGEAADHVTFIPARRSYRNAHVG